MSLTLTGSLFFTALYYSQKITVLIAMVKHLLPQSGKIAVLMARVCHT
ncbi:MAG: hypothetical protein QM235_12895 [Pseudomonadota bacterium]|nr:hypothetical protein [Pseudomonadota bacterium]